MRLAPTPLTPESVIRFLYNRRMLSARVLVEHKVQVEEVLGKNRNFRVLVEGGPSYFVKQALEDEAECTSLQVEGALYRRAHQDPAWARLLPLVPCFRLYDASQMVLVMNLAIGLEEVGASEAEDPLLGLAGLSRATALALASYHTACTCNGRSDAKFLPRQAPAVLTYLGRPPLSALREISPAQIQVIQAIQHRPDIHAMLEDLSIAWNGDVLIHGDLKWANLLARPAAAGTPAQSILIVDWELASWGDPAWDVGSMVHSYFAHAIANAPLSPGLTPAEAAQALGAAIVPIREELRSFWTAYLQGTSSTFSDDGSFLDRTIRCAVARLLQSAYEWSEGEPTMPGRAAALLQLAINIERGGQSIREIFLGRVEQN